MRGRALAIWTTLLLAVACGGGGSAQPPPPPTPVITVAISPAGVSLWTGGTQAFQATVTGTPNTAVTWSVVEASGGSISASGLYTAPGGAGSFHVKATSGADASKWAQALVTVSVQPPIGACNGAALGIGASLQGFTPFPADNAWNQDISAVAVDPNSAAIIAFIGAGTGLHPDFGAGLWQGAPIGIPYTVVASSIQPKVPVAFTAYGSESDPGPMPLPARALLSWTATNATRTFLTPDLGWVTGPSVTVRPTITTTYTLEVQGPYGSALRTVQVVVAP